MSRPRGAVAGAPAVAAVMAVAAVLLAAAVLAAGATGLASHGRRGPAAPRAAGVASHGRRGAATSPPVLTPYRRCKGDVTLPPGQPVAAWRLGAIHFVSGTAGVALTAARIPCVSRAGAWGIEVGSERQSVVLAVTQDGGRHWLTAGTALPPPPGGALAEQVAVLAGTVWASTGAGPLMATSSAGRHWAAQPVAGPVAALSLAGRTLVALGCPYAGRGQCRLVLVRKALPNGRWRRGALPRVISDPYPLLAAQPGRILLVQGEPDGSAARVILTSADGGRVWRRVADPAWMGRPCQVAALATAPPGSWWLLCLGAGAAGSATKGLLRTTDAGGGWTIASQVTGLGEPERPGTIAAAEPNALAAGSPRRLWLATFNGLTQSAEAGTTWTGVPGVNPQGAPAVFDVLSPTHAWLLAAGQGLWQTTDSHHWHAL